MRHALALVLLLAAWSGPAAASEPYRDARGRFAVAVPGGWAAGPDAAMPAITVLESPAEGPKDPFREHVKIVAAELSPGLTLDGYVENSKAAYQAIWKVHADTPTTVAGVPARRLVLDQTLGPAKTRLLKVFLVAGEQIFVITGAAEPQAFTRTLPAFEAVVASFVPGTPAPPPSGTTVSHAPRFAFTHLAAYQIAYRDAAGAMLLARKVPGGKATLRVTLDAGQASERYAAVRAEYEDGSMGAIVGESHPLVAGAKAHRLDVSYREDGEEDYEAVVVAAHGGLVVTIRYSYPQAKPPAEALAEFEAVLASWRWLSAGGTPKAAP